MNKFISDIFKPFNIDIVDTIYLEKNNKFIVYQIYEEESLYADNKPQSYQYSGNFRFYSKGKYLDIRDIKNMLLDNHFVIENDYFRTFETDTKLYVHGLNFNFNRIHLLEN